MSIITSECFFVIINVIVTFAALFLILYAKVLPSIHSNYLAENEHDQSVYNTISQLDHSDHILRETIEQESRTVSKMTEKINVWYSLQINAQTKNESIRQKLHQELHRQWLNRAQEVAQKAIERRIWQEALIKARKDLTQKFADKQQTDSYVSIIIKDMNRKHSL